MYELGDTIVAVSSPPLGKRTIVRISGPDTLGALQQISDSPIGREKKGGVTTGNVAIDADLKIDAKIYLFPAPHSYTGQTLAEIHIYANSSIAEILLENLLSKGLRLAGPGEFTARAYLNGKIDLAQAEAVNEIITSSNKFQLAAAEKLLAGRLAQTTEKISSVLLDCLALIEARLDFGPEDIESETTAEALQKLSSVKEELKRLLAGSITCESTLDLPSVGIAGAPNAGKSTLLNKLLGRQRSIVSGKCKTTRDVLTSELTLKHCRCALFDCAGLITATENILDELTQQAAIEALRNSSAVVFCVDVSKADWAEDISIRRLIEPEILIPVATKSDLLPEKMLADSIAELNKLFDAEFSPASAATGLGLEQLRDAIDKKLIRISLGGDECGTDSIVITARHRQTVTDAIENISQAADELKAGSGEVAAMLLRAAYQSISGIGQHVDEEILDRIFSRFCIGK
jgi:tRNA modification GTPase